MVIRESSKQVQTTKSFQHKTEKWLNSKIKESGINLNGNSNCDPKIYNFKFYSRVIRDGSLGLGESYVDGWWDCKNLDEMICKLLISNMEDKVKGKFIHIKNNLLARIINMQSINRAFEVAHKHYDVGNELYENMLDETMSYSCGYWKNSNNLLEAQNAKLDLVCKKLQLKDNEDILEIGCGWGSFAHFATKNYNVKVKGVTVSSEQKKFIEQRYPNEPIDVQLMDYRDISGIYDKVVSIGMFEHVGEKNYDIYFKTAFEHMKDDGIFVLHTIGSDLPKIGTDAWIHKYIFPNGQIPSISQISKSCEEYFVIEDIHNFGLDYDKTLMAWFENFDKVWPKLKKDYDDRFYRMWTYYLKSCAGAFRSRKLQLFQVVLRKRLKPLNKYNSVR